MLSMVGALSLLINCQQGNEGLPGKLAEVATIEPSAEGVPREQPDPKPQAPGASNDGQGPKAQSQSPQEQVRAVLDQALQSLEELVKDPKFAAFSREANSQSRGKDCDYLVQLASSHKAMLTKLLQALEKLNQLPYPEDPDVLAEEESSYDTRALTLVNAFKGSKLTTAQELINSLQAVIDNRDESIDDNKAAQLSIIISAVQPSSK